MSNEDIINESVLTGMVLIGALSISTALDLDKYFNQQGKVSYQFKMSTLVFTTMGAFLAYLSIASGYQNYPRIEYIGLKVALAAAPVLFSMLKRTQVLTSGGMEKFHNYEVDYKKNAPYFYDGNLRDAQGREVSLGYENYKVKLNGNPFGVGHGYIPAHLIDGLEPRTPLRLFYKGTPIEVIPSCFKCTKMKFDNTLNDWDPTGLLRLADGSKITRKPNERLVELEFGENQILKKGHLPERFAQELKQNGSLELKYRGTPILVTTGEERAEVELDYDAYDQDFENGVKKVLNTRMRIPGGVGEEQRKKIIQKQLSEREALILSQLKAKK